MDQRPVSGTVGGKPPSWGLAEPGKAQALVVTGFSTLPTGRALFLEFTWRGDKGGGAWLKALHEVAPITPVGARENKTAALAFTYHGLVRMGLPRKALESFSAPFREGMFQEDRLRRLGDRRKGEWQETVIKPLPLWSANTPQRGELAGVEEDQSQKVTATGHLEKRIETSKTVHALLLLYDADEDCAQKWAEEVETTLAPHKVKVVHTLPLDLRPDANDIAREHFGFADGISQPMPYDADGAVVLNTGGTVTEPDPWNGVPLGEILFGYTNGHHEKAPGPVVETSAEGVAAELKPHPLAENCLDLGIDGSYMVVRELKQDVAAFWEAMHKGAERIKRRDPDHSDHVNAEWLAERAIGRNLKGDLLCPDGYLPPNKYKQPENDFGFYDRDLQGYGCPVGSHVRRANPRDALAPTPDQKPTMLASANNHRILRRGRKYGETISDPPKQNDRDRGLLFVCLNTDIARQFEFVQQTWLLNKNFATLFDETDPLIGPKGTMTIHEDPLRRIVEVETFVQMVGGDYFFLPSMPALRYLASFKL